MKRASPKAIAWATVPAWARGPSLATMSLSSSGLREENITGWPLLIHKAPMAPPILPAPIMPMGRLAWARAGATIRTPLAASRVRRVKSSGMETSHFGPRLRQARRFATGLAQARPERKIHNEISDGPYWCQVGFRVISSQQETFGGGTHDAPSNFGGRICRACLVASGLIASSAGPDRRFRSFYHFG